MRNCGSYPLFGEQAMPSCEHTQILSESETVLYQFTCGVYG